MSRVGEWLGSCLALDAIVYLLWLGSEFGFHYAHQTYFKGFSTRLAGYFCYSFFTIFFHYSTHLVLKIKVALLIFVFELLSFRSF